jgi:hypothetical protein
MKGVTEVSVLVSDPEDFRGVVSRQTLQTAVELKLRQNGLVVNPWKYESLTPYIFVDINVLKLKESPQFVFDVRLSCKRLGDLEDQIERIGVLVGIVETSRS